MADKAETIAALLKQRVSKTPVSAAFLEKDIDGIWIKTTWEQFYQKALSFATGLVISGLKPGDKLAILMPNCLTWELVQHAGFMTGCIVAGLDLNDSTQQLEKKITDAGIKTLAVKDAGMLDQFSQSLLNSLTLILVVENQEANRRFNSVQPLCELMVEPQPQILPNIKKNDLAVLLFTSGTTGDPKILYYDHQQLTAAVEGITGQMSTLPDQAHSACWLPLASPFQRMINWCGLVLNLKTFMVPDPMGIITQAKEIHPHFLAAVPRFYEKLYEGIQSRIQKLPKLVHFCIKLAQDSGYQYQLAQRKNQRISLGLRIKFKITDYLFFRKIRSALGNNISFLISGSAPLSCSLLEKFHAMGFLILESYGISENIIPMSMNTIDDYCFGTVGKPLAQNTITIANDGEILVKGIGIARNPIETTPEGPLKTDGFLNTDDTGFFDEKGYLCLTGRKSDIFKLSTGRKISPLIIESLLKEIQGVDHAVIYGENKKYITAMLNISHDSWHQLKNSYGSEQKINTFIRQEIKKATKTLPSYCKPGGFFIIHNPFTPKTGELTSNLKVRRKYLLESHRDRFASLYKGD